MAKEIELKLECLEEVSFSELQDELLKQDAVLDEATLKTAMLANTYFDTTDLVLHKSKIALRIREKAGCNIQTLKTAGFSVNGLHQRGEWEWLRTEPTIDGGLLEETSVWDERIDTTTLRPIFKTDFMRTSCELNFGGVRFELALDEGRVSVKDSKTDNEIAEPICEIEVEVIAGSASLSEQELHDVLKRLESIILTRFPVQTSDVSKAERGYNLFRSLPS